MAKSCAILMVSALCILSLVDMSQCHKADQFFVEGKVYCDTCRAQSYSRVCKDMEGAKVKLECRSSDELDGKNVTFSGEAVTDSKGEYSIEVDGDHEEEICEVLLLKSSDDECNEISSKGLSTHRARVNITNNDGITNHVRHANPLGFMKNQILPECKEMLRQLEYDETGFIV